MDENEKQEEEIVEIDVTETSINGELKAENERDLSVFSMEELIQEMHILIGHIICELIDQEFTIQ